MSEPRIVLYATKTCPHCAAARAAIEASGESYVERDPLASGEVLRELLACAASAVVPTIVVGGRALVGFDADRFNQMMRSVPLQPGPPDDYTEEELSGAGDDLSLIP
jgi:glutaredoxin 3